MKQRWALVLVGAWIAGSIWTSVVATQNFYTIDRLLAASPNASFSSVVQRLGQPEARDLLRYLSSELNRLYFRIWNVAQIGIAALTLWLIAGRTPRDVRLGRARTLVVGMLSVVVLMLVYLTPQIVSIGRSLDFVPRDPAPPQLRTFWILHAAYTSLEMLKLAAAFVVAASIANVADHGPAEAGPHTRIDSSSSLRRSNDREAPGGSIV